MLSPFYYLLLGKDFVDVSAASFKCQTVSTHSISTCPSLYHLGAYISQKQPHYQSFSELREHQIQPTIHLQNNQDSFLNNTFVYQQQPAIPQTYQYQQVYTNYPGMFVQPFPARFSATRTALATENSNTLLRNNCELNVGYVFALISVVTVNKNVSLLYYSSIFFTVKHSRI